MTGIVDPVARSRRKFRVMRNAPDEPKYLEGREALKSLCSKEIQRPLVRALDHLDAGNLVQALQEFSKAAAIEPTNKAVLYFSSDAAQRAYFALKHQDVSPPPEKLALWRECALTLSMSAAEADPTDSVAAHNVGRFIQDDGDDQGSIQWYEYALARNRELCESWGNLGTALYTIGAAERAEVCWSRCVSFPAVNATGLLAQSYVWLRRGDYARGWSALNARWKDQTFVQNYGRKDLPGKPWNGERLSKRDRLLVHGEQGLGDHVMFARYVKVLLDQGLPVAGIETRAPLKRWFEAALPNLPVFVRNEDALPHITHHVPMMNLPGVLKLTDLGEPLGPFHYVPRETSKRVGIVWSGAKGNIADWQRSIPDDCLSQLADVPVTWVPMQYDPTGEYATTAEHYLGQSVELPDPWYDVLSFAERLATLDHLVTVDTLAAHVAGSIGLPTTLLHRFNAEWRWGQAGSWAPWYPAITHLKCPAPNDWTTPLGEVAQTIGTDARTHPE